MSNFHLRPLRDRIIIKQDAAAEKTVGGIIIPDTAKEKPNRGIVLAAGPGTKDFPMELKVGDIVLFPKFSGVEIPDGDQTYLLLLEGEVLCVDEPTNLEAQ